MTAGHKHRTVTVSSFDLWWVRLLRRPVLEISGKHRPYVERSRLVFGVRNMDTPAESYFLTPLGVLHAAFGLTLSTVEHVDLS